MENRSKPQKVNPEKVEKKILQKSNHTSTLYVNMDELHQIDEDDDAEDAGSSYASCEHWAHADWVELCSQLCVRYVLITIFHMLITITNQC